MRRFGMVVGLIGAGVAGLAAQSGYVPQRVMHTATRAVVDFEGMLADLAEADIVFVGEQHDDPNTHRLELAVLEGLARRHPDVIVSLEMFERDAQAGLDRFLAGEVDEDAFLEHARPWPRYDTDYRPLVDFAIERSWPVVAANVPRPLASEISKAGLEALDGKSGDERAWFASDLDCPLGDDPYFTRFTAAMGNHPAGEGADAVAEQQRMTERFYQAQCVKDETMGESIARAFERAEAAGLDPLIVHFNGAFHSDFRLGTVSRAQRRLPGRRIAVVTMVPVDQLDRLEPTAEDLGRADYLVYTIRQ